VERLRRIYTHSPRLQRAIATATRSLRFGDGRIMFGPGRGLRLNPGGTSLSYLLGTTEREVQRFVARRLEPGMTAVDVGANVGYLALLMARRVGPTGMVHAFEPHPTFARVLRRNAVLNGFDWLRVWPISLGATEQDSFLADGDVPTNAHLADEGTPVHIAPLDALGISADLVKIDVEGSELDVLAGMEELIERRRPVIVCEVHATNAAVETFLLERRYDVGVLEAPGVSLRDAHWNAHGVGLPRLSNGYQ
jgi:FkbM family methyltransferase